MVQYKSDCVSLKSIEIYDTILTFLMVGRWSLTHISLQETITRGVNPLIQQWMGSVTTQQLNTFVPTITVTEDQVTHYIIKKSKRFKDIALILSIM
jgi:hypothetical protein